jgi:hypothetical protein
VAPPVTVSEVVFAPIEPPVSPCHTTSWTGRLFVVSLGYENNMGKRMLSFAEIGS